MNDQEQEAQFAVNRARSDVGTAEEEYHRLQQAAQRAGELATDALKAFEKAVRHHEAIRQHRGRTDA